MSKSLGNFFTIRDILQKFNPEVVRFFILTAHYRSPIDFSDQNLEDARLGLTRFYEALLSAEKTLAAWPAPDPADCPAISTDEREVFDLIEALDDRFAEAMDDDFNTALAIGHLFEAVRGLNRLVARGDFQNCPLSLKVLAEGGAKLRRLGGVLGLLGSDPAAWLDGQKSAGLAESGFTADQIETLIAERRQARKERNFARADAIRNELAAQGIELLDAKDGTSWKVK
jgi:cysteinyl-tRNA synthetase